MRTGILALLFVFAGGISSARADVLFSGSVNTSGASCGQSVSGVATLWLSCPANQGDSFSQVMGSGDAFSGNLQVSTVAAPGSGASGAAEVQLHETYVLTGGTGSAQLSFAFSGPLYAGLNSTENLAVTCSLSLDGVNQRSCMYDNTEWVQVLNVQYNVPFSIDFQALLQGAVSGGTNSDGISAGRYEYNFNALGLQVAPTPEPSSMLLLLSGITGTLGVARARRRV